MNSFINNLAIYTKGEEKNLPVIFVHGFPFDHTMWDAQTAALYKNYYCITYDIRGLGKSAAGDGQYTIETFVDDLNSIIDHFKLKKPVLCGLSMGGYISLRAIERMQEKFRALILCDTKSVSDSDETKLKRAKAIQRINEGQFEGFINEKGRPGNPRAAFRMVSGRKCRPRSLYRSNSGLTIMLRAETNRPPC